MSKNDPSKIDPIDQAREEAEKQTPHLKSDLLASQITTLSATGATQVTIGDILGISVNTLKKYYMTEWRLGKAQAIASVGRSLYDQAVGRPAVLDDKNRVVKEELLPNGPAAMFFLKAQAGWRDFPEAPRPVDITSITNLDLGGLNDDEFQQWLALTRKAAEWQARKGLDPETGPSPDSDAVDGAPRSAGDNQTVQ